MMSVMSTHRSEEGLRKRLVEVFKEEKLVLTAYLFGSYARGVRTKRSDIDVAVLLSSVPENLLEYYLGLMNRIAGAVESEVDLIILNLAPPLLKYQVIKYGKLLYSRSERERVLFEARTICEYLDFSRAMRRYDECFMKRILA